MSRKPNSFERKVDSKICFNTKVESWNNIFDRFGITNKDTQKIFKSLPDALLLMGANADIPLMNSHLLRKAIFKVCEIDIQSASIFADISNGICNIKRNNATIADKSRTTAQVNEAIYSYYLSNKDAPTSLDLSSQLSPQQILNSKKIALEYFGAKAYKNMAKLSIEPPLESILTWCWELNANRENKLIEVLELPVLKNKTLDVDLFMCFFKLNFLLKKTTEYIEDNWLDFDKTLISKERFYDPAFMPNVPDLVSLKELKSVMHFKFLVDNLSKSNNYKNWVGGQKLTSDTAKEVKPYINDNKYKDLEDLVNSINLPVWGLEYASIIAKNGLSKEVVSDNQKSLFNDLNVVSQKAILDKTLSSDTAKRKNVKI